MHALRSTTRILSILTLSAAISVVSACTKKEETAAEATNQTIAENTSVAEGGAGAPAADGAAAPAAPAAAQAVDPNKKPDVELKIGTKGDEMAFDTSELSAKAGSVVRLTFTNNAKSSSGMQHNWVLTRQGTDTEVANLGIQAGEAKNWVPESPNVLASTPLLKKGDGETASVTFVAPAAGDYPYICTFPGHAIVMKGVFHSTN